MTQRTKILAIIAGLVLVAGGGLFALVNMQRAPQAEVQGTVWVANEHGNSLIAIDAATNKVVTRLTGIEGPHNLQVAPDGKTVWAVSGHGSLAVMVDATSYKLHGTVPTGKEPAHIIVTPDGKTAYATNGGENTVTAIDIASMKVSATIPVGAYPHGLRSSPDGKWVYVANAKGTTLSVIDTVANQVASNIEVGQKPVQVAFAPDGKFVYVSLNGENALGKVDVATRQLVGKVPVGVGPIQAYVSPDGKYVLVANQGTEEQPSTTVSIIDTSTFTVARTVGTGKGAHGVVIDPSSRYAYISNIYGNDMAVIDLASGEVSARVATDEAPNGISWSSQAPARAPSEEIALALPDHDDDVQEMDH
jgi:YVTN family beta-propeller protein